VIRFEQSGASWTFFGNKVNGHDRGSHKTNKWLSY